MRRRLAARIVLAVIASVTTVVVPSVAEASAAPGPPGNGTVGWDTYRRLDRLAELPSPGLQTKQFSSFDRSGGNNDGFSGAHSCLRTDAAGCVLGEDNGPGEVESIWFTRDTPGQPSGDVTATGWIRVELDGRLVVNRSLQELVNGVQGAPFTFPFVANAEQSSGGVTIKVPMPYRESMRITVQHNPGFYHLTHRHFATPDGITTFDPNDRAEDVLALVRGAGTKDPKPPIAGASTGASTVNVPAGGAVSLGSFSGPGSISALRLRLPDTATSPAALRALRLRLTFDGRTTVDSPVGEFFGSGLGASTVRSLMFAGNKGRDAWFSSWWPMPYRSTATAQLVNTGASPVNGIDSEVTSAPDAKWTAKLGDGGDGAYFTTQSRAGTTTPDRDWAFADLAGRGRLVGVSQTMRGKASGNNTRAYLEGDERAYVDSAPSPQIHGTGTEDFYEAGWYFGRGEFSNPFTGSTGHLVRSGDCASECDATYRLMLGDSIHYASALNFGIEHGPANDVPGDYGSTAFLYTRPEPATRRTDTVEVSKPADRARHAWSEAPGPVQTSVESSYEGDQRDLAVRDEVRATSGEFSFRMTVAPDNNGVLLRRTSDQSTAGQRAEVLVDGSPAGTWYQPLGNPESQWLSDTFTLPAALTAGKPQITLTLRPSAPGRPWTAVRYSADSLVTPAPDGHPPAAPTDVGFIGTKRRSLRLTWKPAVDDVGAQRYLVYGSRQPDVPITPQTLLGTTRIPSFLHRALSAGQAWFYRIAAVDAAGNTGPASAPVTARAAQPTKSDFNGDGRDDIATFTRGVDAKVYVSLSDGGKFVENAWKWHDHFAAGNEVPLVGDFNGDGKDDIATFTRGVDAKVYVSLSDGGKFVENAWKWHDHFAAGNEVPLVGDFNGDGKDDIATFTRGVDAKVYVSLSDGGKFVETGWKWHDHFAANEETPAVADIDGDGRDDIVTFTRGQQGKVYASLSNGRQFVQDGWKWHDHFAVGDEVPATGDVNGDGREDIVTFTRGTDAKVYASLSDGAKFVEDAWKWNDHFSANEEIPGIADANGDGMADAITYTRGTDADVYVSLSDGRRFAQNGWKWHDSFAMGSEVPQPSQYVTMPHR